MAGRLKIRVNENLCDVKSAPDTPLLYVLAGELKLKGPRFGCGLAQCGSCSVLIDGVERLIAITRAGETPRVRPGPQCRWCPLFATCDEGQAEQRRRDEFE